MPEQSGTAPLRFAHRSDLHVLPGSTHDAEINLHGTFAEDRRAGQGQVYYGMPGHGLIQIAPDMREQTLNPLPDPLMTENIHSTRLVEINGEQRFVLTANEAEMIAIVRMDGTLDFLLGRPDLPPYEDPDLPYKPTDTVLVGDTLYVADGYGGNYICAVDIKSQQWLQAFGGKNTEKAVHGKFGTAHGINTTFDGENLLIADRWHSRLQIHAFDGTFVGSHDLPAGAWPCFIDFVTWQGRGLGVITNLYGPDRDRPAPIYIVDAESLEIISTVLPKEALGIEPANRLHNVSWHTHDDGLYLIGQSWNPGVYFVLECVG